MQTFIELFNDELGSSVRGKLNRYLSSIVSGSEGINAIWNAIRDLRTEIQSLDGGVGGLITDPSYDPSNLDTYKSVTLIALGKGTFTNFKDSSGNVITITQDNSFTIFCREAGESYWHYTTTVISATIDTKALSDISDLADLPAVGLAKDGNMINVATNTDAVYDNKNGGTLSESLHKIFSVAKGFVRPEELDSHYYPSGYYVVTNMSEGTEDVICMGLLEVFSDSMSHMMYQRLTINCINPNESYISHEDSAAPRTWERRYNFASSEGVPPKGTWSEWIDISTNNKIGTDSIEDGAVTFDKLYSDLQPLITNISKNATFAGIATPTTNPGTPDGPVFYFAAEPGVYSNFSGISVADEEAVILEWEGSWVKKTTGFATQQQIARLDETDNDLINNSSITLNVVDKIIDLPTSNLGIWKQKYLHVENRNNSNDDAQLYCVYIDGPCKISASNLANMQDGYITRCWAAYSEREINNEYLVSEFSDPSYTPRRTGVSCNLDIPDTVKMVCFSSLISKGKPVINVTTVITNDEITDEIDTIRSETNKKITKDYTYSGDTLDDITETSKYRLGISIPSGNVQGFLYYPRKEVSVSIRNITSDGNACPAIACFKEKIEITADISANYREYLVAGWEALGIANNTRSYEDLIFPEEVKMVYIYHPFTAPNKLEIVEHVGVMEEIASVSDTIASIKSPSILSLIDDVPYEEYDFNEQPIIAKFFADRITHRDKYINTNSRKVYWSPNNGNDYNDGLTASTAVKSYSKVKSMLSNGSELYIERGSVITELCKFNYNGLLIDTYGSELLDNPIFDNFILTDSSEWKQVEGYEHIYKLTRHFEASGDNINSIQVAVDGHNIADIRAGIINGGTYPIVSNCHINSVSSALTRLSEHVNEAWCSCYEGGYSWAEGDYDIYISLNDSPSEHKIEVTNHVLRCLIEFGDCCDIRHINTRGSAGKDGWNIASNTYMEDCHIYDHCHHGFLQGAPGGIMRMYNCSTEAPRGAIGYQFHIFSSTQQSINNQTDMFIDCKSISKGQLGSCVSGHGGSSMYPGLYVYVINCKAEGLLNFIGDTAIIKNLFIKRCRVEDVNSIGFTAGMTLISDIKGTLTLQDNASVFASYGKFGNLRASNLILKCKSLNGISGIFYAKSNASFIDISNCSLKDCKFSIDKVAADTINPSQSGNIFRGYKGANFTNCLFIVTFKGQQGNTLSLYWPIKGDYGGHNFGHCLFFGIKDNSANSDETNKFLKIGDIANIEYLFNRLYTDNGILKLFV